MRVSLDMAPSTPEELQKVASIPALMSAGFAGLGASGWFGEPWSWAAIILVPLVGGIIAGLIEGRTPRARATYAIPYAAGALVAAMATSLYTSGRSGVMNVELLLPMAAGLVPFFLLRWFLSRVAPLPK